MDPRNYVIVATLFMSADASIPREIPSAFLISKSENRNQVHYAVRVDSACRPIAPKPVEPYWRMLERSPTATERLLPKEERVYGIESQSVEGSRTTIRLRALPRPITITTWKDPAGSCRASTVTAINGKSSRLFNIHIALGSFGVRYLLVTGWADDGSVVREKIEP